MAGFFDAIVNYYNQHNQRRPQNTAPAAPAPAPVQPAAPAAPAAPAPSATPATNAGAVYEPAPATTVAPPEVYTLRASQPAASVPAATMSPSTVEPDIASESEPALVVVAADEPLPPREATPDFSLPILAQAPAAAAAPIASAITIAPLPKVYAYEAPKSVPAARVPANPPRTSPLTALAKAAPWVAPVPERALQIAQPVEQKELLSRAQILAQAAYKLVAEASDGDSRAALLKSL
jgi:hypothetical protein